MTLADRIVALLAEEALDDGQIRARLDVRHQAVNHTCRGLERAGRIARRPGPNGRIVNWLIGSAVPEPVHRPHSPLQPWSRKTRSSRRWSIG